MSKERRYQDHEIREILDLALGEEDRPAQSLPSADGLTLVELQEVGLEVGLPPERVAQAVAAYEGRGEAMPRRTTLGLPTSVGRIVSLSRSPADREWELLIAELRTTFGVKGEVASHGGLREWSNNYLHAFIEPTESGYRLRLVDTSAAMAGIVVGGFLLAFALMIFLALLSKENVGFRMFIPAFFGLFGAGVAVASARWIPKWAREQESRMEHISRHAATLLARPASKSD